MSIIAVALLFVAGVALALDDAGRLPGRMRIAAFAAAVCIVAVLAYLQARHEAAYDLAAFYCAGSAVLTHADPFLTASLAPCERAILGPAMMAVISAPQPGYDLALFALLAPLGFTLANAVWIVAVVAALVVASLALRGVTGIPASAIFAALSLSAGYLSIDLGQLAPFMVACISAAAWGASRGRPIAVGVAAGIAMIEPHFGLPVVAAAFLAFPRARVAIAAVGVVFAALALAARGVAGNEAYFLRELLAQAMAESANADQYSVTMLAHWFGANDHGASLAGACAYAAMALFGIAAGLFTARALREPAFALAIPAAAVTLGGEYVHQSQLPLGIPAALLLASRPERGLRTCGIAATVLLALPWETIGYGRLYISAFVMLFALASVIVARPSVVRRAAVAFAVLVFYAGMLAVPGRVSAEGHRMADPVADYARRAAPEATLAASAWGLYMHRDDAHSVSSPRRLAHKVPAWIALLLVLGAPLAGGFRATGVRTRLSNEAGWRS